MQLREENIKPRWWYVPAILIIGYFSRLFANWLGTRISLLLAWFVTILIWLLIIYLAEIIFLKK